MAESGLSCLGLEMEEADTIISEQRFRPFGPTKTYLGVHLASLGSG
jgi:hypothetical protein